VQFAAAIAMALRPMTRLDLVGDQRRSNAPTNTPETEDERDVRESLSRLATTLSAHGGLSLSADLALDLLLNRVVEQARLATNTTGAAIALRRGDDIVCRATSGANAPDLGVRLNTSSGLSGACVQTKQVQICDDTETDLRVDPIACRQLAVRSILIVPVLDEQDLLGVFEVFSPQPHAFGDRDIQTLHALSRRAVDSIARSAEAVSPRRPTPPAETVPAKTVSAKTTIVKPRRDPWTLILTVIVFALAIFLGWLLGRDGWMRTLRGRKTKSAQAQMKTIPQPAPSLASVPPSDTIPAAPTTSPAPAKNAPAAASPGGLVVYQYGKVIFRAKSQQAQSRLESSPDESAPAGSVAKISPENLPPQVAERYLMQRIEPIYPEAARAQHIQGQVLLEATVGKDGSVEELKVISGDAQLATAAGDAVRQWHFRPVRKAGKLIEFQTQITVDFRLP
jgi:TonB family protein